MSVKSLLVLACFLCILGPGSYASADEQRASVGWSEAATPDVVHILTQNEDGSTRETKIWIVLLNGQAYIRTANTRWYRNIERNPDVTLRAEGVEYPATAQLITDESPLDQIEAAFREKYGFKNRLSGLARLGRSNIMRLVAR